MKKTIFIVATALTGCATTGEVSRIGKDTYMVGTSATGGMKSNTEITQMSIARANSFCDGLGRVMMLSHTQSSGVRGWTPQDSEVQFKCLNESDPEYQSVNMRKEPNSAIQVVR